MNRNGDNPIWEIIIQLVNTMMSSLRGIELPIMEPITTILGKHINKDDEEEFYDLVYAPINSVIYALQKLKARERREEAVQAAYDVAQKAKKKRREEAVQAANDVAQKAKMKAQFGDSPVRTSGFDYLSPEQRQTRKDKIASISTERYRSQNPLSRLPSLDTVPLSFITGSPSHEEQREKGGLWTSPTTKGTFGGRKKRTKRKNRRKKKKRTKRKKRK